jgi:hypothetical protein
MVRTVGCEPTGGVQVPLLRGLAERLGTGIWTQPERFDSSTPYQLRENSMSVIPVNQPGFNGAAVLDSLPEAGEAIDAREDGPVCTLEGDSTYTMSIATADANDMDPLAGLGCRHCESICGDEQESE